MAICVTRSTPQGEWPIGSDARFRLRLGTALWHGDKSFLQLSADVTAVHPVNTGDRAGYQLSEVPGDGSLVIVTAGSAHGVAALPNGASPFHFARSRLRLLEPPHMHSSMLFVPSAAPCPAVGDRVDVQRPLITTLVDGTGLIIYFEIARFVLRL